MSKPTLRTWNLTEEEYREFTDEMVGLCLACGNTKECCEPDLRADHCPDCGQMTVFGTEEALLMGRIEITDTGEE